MKKYLLLLLAGIATAYCWGLRYGTTWDAVMRPRLANSKDSVPAAPMITGVADPDGDPYATITLTPPVKDKGGNPLAGSSALTELRLYRAGKLLRSYPVSADDSCLVVHDTVTANDKSYSYQASAVNKYGEGAKASKSVYIGIQKPGVPTNVTIHETGDQRKVRLTWRPPLLDAGKNRIDPATLCYKVSVKNASNQTGLIKDNVTDTSFIVSYSGAEPFLCSFTVMAKNRAGSSSAATSANQTIMGPGSTLPFAESWKEGAVSNLVYFRTIGAGNLGWTRFRNGGTDGVAASDNDNGYASTNIVSVPRTGMMQTDYITIDHAAQKPALFVSVYKSETQADHTVSLVAIKDSVVITLDSVLMKSLPCNGWNILSADLSAYKGQKLQFGVTVNAREKGRFIFDNLRVCEAPSVDLGFEAITHPIEMFVGRKDSISAAIRNYATVRSAPYEVALYRNNIRCNSVAMPALEPLQTVSVSLEDVVSPASTDTTAVYRLAVELQGDQDTSNNNAVTDTLAVVPSSMPSVRGLVGSGQSQLKLTWIAPDMQKVPLEPVTEDFEGCSSFTDSIRGWTNIDGDGINTIRFTINGKVLPVSGQKHAFFVIDNSTSPWNSSWFSSRDGGHRFAASLCVLNNGPVNDWLITPELSGCRQRIEFYATAYFDYKMPYEVLISSTTSDTTAFSLLEKGEFSSMWKRFAFVVPEGTRYLAFHAIHPGPYQGSADAPIWMIDDVNYIPLGTGKATLIGYNVYRDEELLTTVPAASSFCTVKNIAGTHQYKVSALYDRGESMPMVVSATGSVDAVSTPGLSVCTEEGAIIVTGVPEGVEVSVCDARGMSLRKLRPHSEARIPAPQGLYIVKAGKEVFKVFVR